ncbi:Crp/Fnr family transcriptional regulator [Sagittula sp. S175]|uniref:Crp/Fnr family transcriptional regulator n=1 Tax=Sagittula sp. S175 TaxID=3415129 RepID=UPI003C7A841B
MNVMTPERAGISPCSRSLQTVFPFSRPALFRGLTTADMRRVEAAFGENLYGDGDPVPRDADDAAFVALLLEGTLREDVRDPEGGTRLLSLAFTGETLSPLGPRCRGGRLTAIGTTRLLTCDRDGFDRLADAVPRLRVNLLGLFQDQLAEAHRWQILLGRKTASERIASMLAWFHGRQGAPDEMHLPVSRAELGQMSGLTLETVSRQMRALERQGVIRLPLPTRVRVLDLGALQDLTGDVSARRPLHS